MNTENNYLLTLVNGNTLLKVAVRYAKLTEKETDYLKYWAEPDSQAWIKGTLPSYIESIGDIVLVEELFAII